MNELIELNNKEYQLNYDVAMKIAFYETQIKKAKELEEEIRNKIKQEMEEKGIKSLISDYINISYVDEYDSVRLDNNKLKEKYREIYDECSKISHTNSSIKITLKKGIESGTDIN